jgi:hypothetical protein
VLGGQPLWGSGSRRSAAKRSTDRERSLLSALLKAAEDGNFAELESLSAVDVASYSHRGDAGRAAPLSRCRVHAGGRHVAAFADRFRTGGQWTGST